jgi:DNA repair exonuclease SbcCD ATPase subunit
MSLYVHGRTTHRPATEADLAQARHRNSQLAAELRQLDAIGERLQQAIAEKKADLEAQTEQARKELTQGYRHLRSKIRQLDAVRANAEMIENTKAYTSDLPEPLFGGREGLEAATDEMADYEARRNGRTLPPRGKRVATERKLAVHGTSLAYRRDKCRCPECKAWMSRTSAKHYRNKLTRQTLQLVDAA